MANSGLYRSNRHNMIAGVIGGIAERFGWSPTLLRIIFVVVSLMSAAFPGILVYLVLWLIMPKQTQRIDSQSYNQNNMRTVSEESNFRR